MINYIVEISSREQFQHVIDYVGTDTYNNSFDKYEGNVLIYVRNDNWTYSSREYYEENKDEDYAGVRLYSFEEFEELVINKKETPVVNDMINHPSHYKQFNREVIDTMQGMSTPDEFKGYLKLNAVKYISRYQGKNGVEDLSKAIWYVTKLKEVLEEEK